MNDIVNDDALLAELGLTGDTAPTETATATTAEPKERAKRSEIKIVGKIASGISALLPAQERNGGGFGERERKYPFDDLVAPTKDVDGNVTGFAYFEVLLADVENADAKKLRGAIQAAVAASNKSAKEKGTPERFVSRTKLDDDKAYIGSVVYRVDDTQDEDEAPAEAAAE